MELFYRQKLGKRNAIMPHLRWYRQGAADFYRLYLVDNTPLPNFASADTRLAGFDAFTLGLQYFFTVADHLEFSLSGEYYAQLGDRSPPDAFGQLRDFDLLPDLNVAMIRAGFSYGL